MKVDAREMLSLKRHGSRGFSLDNQFFRLSLRGGVYEDPFPKYSAHKKQLNKCVRNYKDLFFCCFFFPKLIRNTISIFFFSVSYKMNKKNRFDGYFIFFSRCAELKFMVLPAFIFFCQ